MDVRNEGSQTVRYRTEDFILRVGDDEYEAIPLGRLITDTEAGNQEARIARTTGIRGATLDPGDSEDGFLFFRKKVAEGQPRKLEVSLSLYDPEHETMLEAIRIPLVAVE